MVGSPVRSVARSRAERKAAQIWSAGPVVLAGSGSCGGVGVFAPGSTGQRTRSPLGRTSARGTRRYSSTWLTVCYERHEFPVHNTNAPSSIAAGKVDVAAARGEQLEPGHLVNAQGQPSIDPADYRGGGALLPFGGHKGYCLAMFCEVLAGALTGPAAARPASIVSPTASWACFWTRRHSAARSSISRKWAPSCRTPSRRR